MPQCGASLVMVDPADGIEKNFCCQKSERHTSTHVTTDGQEFTDSQDWRAMLATKT